MFIKQAAPFFFCFLSLFAMGAWFVGLIVPKVFSRLFKGHATRKKVSAVFGGTAFVSFMLIASTIPPDQKQSPTPQAQPTLSPAQIREQQAQAKKRAEAERKRAWIAQANAKAAQAKAEAQAKAAERRIMRVVRRELASYEKAGA